MILSLVFCSLWASGVHVQAASPELGAFVPIGVRYQHARNDATRRHDLEEMRRLHFNVVAIRTPDKPAAQLHYVDRLLSGAPYTQVDSLAGQTVTVIDLGDGPDTTARAWSALARGARVILFGDWTALQRNTAARQAAAVFAEAVGRNATLYAPMRPRSAENAGVQVSPQAGDVHAAMLESPDALLVIAINNAAAERQAVLTFANDVPEAIWQNMMTGTTLSFVTTAAGSTYTRTFAAKEVVVLMINKKVRTRSGFARLRCRLECGGSYGAAPRRSTD